MDKKYENLTDNEIIDIITGGNVNAYEILIERHKNHIFKVVGRHMSYELVEETAHEAFVRAYISLPTFGSQPTFGKKGSFKGWLTSIALRTCNDHWRKAYRNREQAVSSASADHSEWLTNVLSGRSLEIHENETAQQEARDILNFALDTLSADDRMVIELVYLEGFTAKEAAALLGWSTANVKIRIFRAKIKLKKVLSTLSRKVQ